MFDGCFKMIDPYYDYEINSILDFFKIMYYYFSGSVSTEKGSHAWNLVKEKKHQEAFDCLFEIIDSDEIATSYGLNVPILYIYLHIFIYILNFFCFF